MEIIDKANICGLGALFLVGIRRNCRMGIALKVDLKYEWDAIYGITGACDYLTFSDSLLRRGVNIN
jgi:hypothetical protein